MAGTTILIPQDPGALGGETLTGPLITPAGTVSAAGLGVGQANTGLFAPAAGQVAFAVNGIQGMLYQKYASGNLVQCAMNGAVVSNIGMSLYGLTNDGTSYVAKMFSSTGVDLFDFRANGQFTAAGTINTNTPGTAPAPGLAIFNADGGLYRVSAGVMGIASNGLTAGQIDATQNWSFYGTGGLTGTNTGAATNIKSVAASTTLAGATTTSVLIPAGSLVIGVTARVTTLITGATTWSLGDGTTATRWAATKALAAGTTSTQADYGATGVPAFFQAATNVVVTANGSNFTGGVLRVVVFYQDVTAPTA